ncbi:LysR family transcriptional regulator [Sporosarcina obsidiansis]|uniref:LysR family transcriptional regulator n=1 Tax=Sporosarcina obsidiansis TaxID=2660748 RepID=UPI00129AFA7B|nr:LysR family transcriptional regulator [Sporosarcina obsidiansis]
MNIEQLTYIVEVARTRSITLASENLHVSISAISQSISNLESEFGTKLFTRSRQGSLLTYKGKKIVEMAHDILIRLEKLREEAQADTTLIQTKLKIATVPGFISHLITPLYALNIPYPNVKFEFIEQGTGGVITNVQQHKVDLGLICLYGSLLQESNDFIFHPIIEGQVKVYVNKNSLLAYKKTVTPQDLLDQNLVCYDGEHINWFVDDFFSKYGPMNILFSSNQTEGIIKAVLEGVAISFASDFSYENHPQVLNGNIISLEIIENDAVKVTAGWIISKTKHFSESANIFVEYLKSEFRIE